MLNLLRLTALVLAVLVAGADGASAAVVQRIDVVGNTRIDADTVRANLTIRVGEPFTQADIDESIDTLFATGFVDDASIAISGSTLVVTIDEAAVINRVNFEGNRAISDELLTGVVKSRSRGTYSVRGVQEDVQAILRLYRGRGNYEAAVKPQIIDRGLNRVDLIFDITEGRRAHVTRVTFIGNSAYSDSRLRDVVSTKESGLLGFLRQTDVYDPARLESDQELLRRFYFNNGYADFRIVSATANYDRERNAFLITITIDEGERYMFGDIRVDTTLADLAPETLQDSVRTRPGRPYSAKEIESSIEELALAANRKGYAFAEVVPSGERDFEANTIAVVYRVDQGIQAYIERIEIAGNVVTRENVIRREFEISEGDPYNKVLLERAERRLRNLGFFETVEVTAARGSELDRVVVTVRVVERATGSVSFGAGYSTDDGIVGEISVEEKNFLGRGQHVRAAVTGGATSQGVEFSFTEPYFLGRRVSAGFDLFYRMSEYDDDDDDDGDDEPYDTDEIGGAIRFGIPITDKLAIQPFYRLSWRDVTVDENDCLSGEVSRAVCDSEGERVTSLIGTSLIYNSLDNQLTPREGVYATLTGEVAGVGGDAAFVRGTAKIRTYREVVPAVGLVAMVSASGGVMNSLNDDLRIQDQFSLGGSVLRGFATSGVGPRDRATGDPLGGRYYVASTLEATFPIPSLPPEAGLVGSVFADAGSVWGVDPDIAARNGGANSIISDDFALRASTGVGLLWRSPFGPIRADLAVPLLEEDSDDTQLFRLSGGTAF